MRLSQIGEDGIIEKIVEIVGNGSIGDDCASVNIDGRYLLLTTDVLVEDIHFVREILPSAIGWKAITANVSDIVAGGGRPKWALVSLILPDIDMAYLEEIYRGMRSACEFYGCRVVGGNISRGRAIAVDIFMVGEAGRAVGRRGALPGDTVYVSGTLGDSRAGFEIFMSKRRDLEDFEKALVERHIRPTARLDYVKHIEKHARASMDISDGLIVDASRLAKRSGIRIDIDSGSLPVSAELMTFCKRYGKDPMEYALAGGEDYQLLFCHPRERENPFLDMTPIGTVMEGEGLFIDGKALEGGYRHF